MVGAGCRTRRRAAAALSHAARAAGACALNQVFPISAGALELSLPAEAAAGLRRHDGLGGAWRVSKLRRVWHDTPDGLLAGRNLALSEEQGAWQAGPLQAREAAWLPGPAWPTPPAATADEALGHALEAPLVPLVILSGERWRVRLAQGDVSLSVLRGQWQTLAAQRPFCRLRLDGAAPAVAETAVALARHYPLEVPPAGLAAEALAFARGEKLPARRLGSPVLAPGLSTEQGFIEIVAHLTEVLVYWAGRLPPGTDAGEPLEPVHQMRVALRRLRAGLRAFAEVLDCPGLPAVKQELKFLGQMLGPARDWDVFLAETLGSVLAAMPQAPPLVRLRSSALRQRRAHYARLHMYLAEGGFTRLALALACLTVERPWAVIADDTRRAMQIGSLQTYAVQLLRRRRRQLLHAGEHLLELPPEALHALRLKGKYLRYIAEFFAPLFPDAPSGRFIRRLANLQAQLGALNDGSVAGGLMQRLPPATLRGQGMVQGFVAARAGNARAMLAESWKRFRKQEAFWVT